MAVRQEQQAQRNTEQAGQHEPARATQVDFLPVLHYNDAGDGDGDEHGQGRGHGQRNAEREQRNRDQRLTETESGPDHRSDKDDP